jgi:membrane associated rhomboid family serine protease
MAASNASSGGSVGPGASSGPGPGAGAGSRVRELFDAVPPVSRFLLLVNVGIYIWMFLDSTPLNPYSINAFAVIKRGEYYRIVSSAFVHASAMHIFMNMTTLLQLGPHLEKSFGSLIFFLVTVWTIVFAGGIYIGLSW